MDLCKRHISPVLCVRVSWSLEGWMVRQIVVEDARRLWLERVGEVLTKTGRVKVEQLSAPASMIMQGAVYMYIPANTLLLINNPC